MVHGVYFSATGNSAKIVRTLADYIGQNLDISIRYDNFTQPSSHVKERSYTSDDIVVFGVPTFAGRVPNKVLPFVQSLFKGNNTPAVAVVTFGNRNFDSSLTELVKELSKNGFIVVGAAAVCCNHSFGDIGQNRPDESDYDLLKALSEKFSAIYGRGIKNRAPVTITGREEIAPYYTPLKEDNSPAKFLKAKPKTDLSLCRVCGKCAAICPMEAISKENTSEVPGLCIKCQACIKICGNHAKYFDDPDFLSHKKMLENSYQRRAESEIFI